MPDSIAISADGYLDDMRRDPDSELGRLLRNLAEEIADGEREFVPKDTGRTLGTIRVEDHFDADGFFEPHAVSDKLITNINESSTGVIDNRRSRYPAKWPATPSIRRAVPFQSYAVDAVAVIE